MNLQINALTHMFTNGKPQRTALADFNLSVDSGQFVALIGPSGCGKTTLLRLVGDLLLPSQWIDPIGWSKAGRDAQSTCYRLDGAKSGASAVVNCLAERISGAAIHTSQWTLPPVRG